ncbi:uncharacterized protein [Temnothorax nylanderi]|uniref:uncharacterized protein n=1 Tax=Temnothorax nylanderi TaxID=102681 RepID=UPI003A86B929
MGPLAVCITIIALSGTPVYSLLGFDCRGKGLNVTTLSLTDIGDCELEDLEPVTEETYLQLLQLSEFDHTVGIQCKIEIDRDVQHCGWSSYNSAVQGGKYEYIHEIPSDACRKMQDSGTIYLGGASGIIAGIKVNATTTRAITLAGSLTMDGDCEGAQYSDPMGTWSNVFVQATVKITTRRMELPVKHSTNKVTLPSGIRCPAMEGECYDADGTMTFWKTLPTDTCQFNKYDVLYEGKAHRVSPKPGQKETPVIYTLTTRDITFALARTTETSLCGYKIIQTEHPKLFILETQPGRTFKIQTGISIDNLDIFSYVNSKFIYVEKHMRTQLTQMYRDIMSQKCALEKQILENALSLASIAPDEMAYRIMKSPGYTAITAGEVIYIVKCVPVTCKVRQTENCYSELAVSHNNASHFLLPKSRVLTKSGTLRDCNELLPTMYRIDDAWFKLTPRPVEALPPPTIQPLSKPQWKYVNPANLATSGIYSTQDLDRLRNHIMFPIEKPAMINTLVQGAMGRNIPRGTVSLYNLMDEESLEKIAENTGQQLWNGFVTFGSASAGVLAIILLFRLAKLIIDSIIRGYALHSVYGWSMHLLGAVWSSVTHLLLHLSSRTPTTEDTDPEAPPAEMTTLVTTKEEPSTSHGSVKEMDYGELRKYLHGSK